VTKECNFACSYCFEGEHCRQIEDIKDKVDDIKTAISNLFEDEWFNEKFGSILLVLWGGEPTLRPDILQSFVDEYKDDERVAFMMYSNGSRPDIIMDIFEPVKEKFEVQISYDGNPIHDKNRKNMLGGSTSTLAREAIRRLKKEGFKTLVKSTLRTSDIKHMVEVWDDFKSLSIENNELINYAPTIEYKKDFDPKDLEDFEDVLKKIVVREAEHFKEHGKFLFAWVDGAKKHCNLFQEGLFVDVDGGLYYCHGCPYESECGQMWFGDITDDCLTDYMKDNYMKFRPRENKACEQCIASTCLNCNVVNYINSDMDEFIDRWYDFECTPVLCDYYKLFGKYNEVLRRLLRR
jgi:sulfatase maturation enzyme AslB (radical SAM superfamily)